MDKMEISRYGDWERDSGRGQKRGEMIQPPGY
jgi:hypothetical protein